MEIRRNSELCNIPVIILSVTDRAEDILDAWHLDKPIFLNKPRSASELDKFIEAFKVYWPQIVSLPY